MSERGPICKNIANSNLNLIGHGFGNLIAPYLDKSEEEVQAMKDRGDSLDRVELVIASEEVLDPRQRK
jgi:hypothetical protein